MARARRGDVQAFGELVRRHMQRIYAAALALVGSHDDALDLSQEAFVRAYRARGSLDPARPFYPWLYQILRRLWLNFLRDASTRRERTAEAGPWLVAQAEARAGTLDPARKPEREALRARVEAAIARLPAAQREVLVLKEFQQLKYREIAELLDIPTGTVMSRLYTARRQLADWLGGDA